MEDSRAIHLSQFRTRSERIHEPIKAWPPARTAKKNQTARDYDSMMNLTKPGFCYVDAMEESVDKHMNEIYSNYIRGVHRAAEMRILFAGLIRNAEASVWRSYLALKELGRHFADYRFLVLENDSDDQTSQKMREVARMDKKYEIRSETLGFGDERSLEAPRMRRMANLRNRLHKWVAEKFQSGERWDLIAMYDFDINLFHRHAVSPHGFFAALGRKEIDSWDMICANSLRHSSWRYADPIERNGGSVIISDPDSKVGMYDCFALRLKGMDKFNEVCQGSARREYLFRFNTLHQVHSCFGGLGLYKPERFLKCRYDWRSDDCEHVSMHTCMRQKGSEGRMFMDPMMTTLYDDNIDYKCRGPDQLVQTVAQR